MTWDAQLKEWLRGQDWRDSVERMRLANVLTRDSPTSRRSFDHVIKGMNELKLRRVHLWLARKRTSKGFVSSIFTRLILPDGHWQQLVVWMFGLQCSGRADNWELVASSDSLFSDRDPWTGTKSLPWQRGAPPTAGKRIKRSSFSWKENKEKHLQLERE